MIKLFEKPAQNISTMQQTRREPANGCQSDLEEQTRTKPPVTVAGTDYVITVINYPKLVTCKIEFIL